MISVVCSALEYCLNVENMNLSAIRTIRVLRPLRAINRIPSKYERREVSSRVIVDRRVFRLLSLRESVRIISVYSCHRSVWAYSRFYGHAWKRSDVSLKVSLSFFVRARYVNVNKQASLFIRDFPIISQTSMRACDRFRLHNDGNGNDDNGSDYINLFKLLVVGSLCTKNHLACNDRF